MTWCLPGLVCREMFCILQMQNLRTKEAWREKKNCDEIRGD